MSFGGGSAPGPSAAQIQAQETQARLAAEQEKQLKQAEIERQATARARAGMMGGRSLLMMDETGFFRDPATGLQQRLGSSWRTPPAGSTVDSASTGGGGRTGGLFQGMASWLSPQGASTAP